MINAVKGGLFLATLFAMVGPGASLASGTASDQELIGSAMRAAPENVALHAKIVVMDDKGGMRTLREGKNGFTCMPDNTVSPGQDPMCMDKAAMAWVHDWVAHKKPPVGRIGFMYMLAGGSDSSNTDPYAAKPEPGNHWVTTGSHVMIVGAKPGFYDMYPKSADPDTSVPYVMWPGTPWQHLMIPVR